MKVRIGFVSNSSSSNFIINDSAYKTVFDLAKAMIIIRDKDNENNNTPEIKKINIAIREGRDPNSAIYFSTCNYDTYIKKIFNNYIVITCHNHPFIDQLYGSCGCHPQPYQWLKDHGYINESELFLSFTEEFDSWKFQCKEIFWSPKYDLEMLKNDCFKDKKKRDFCKNKHHFQDMMVLASTKEIICPVCYIEKQEKNQEPIDNRFEILDLDIRENNED